MYKCRTGTRQTWAHLKIENLHFKQKLFVFFSSDRGNVTALWFIKSKVTFFHGKNLSSLRIETTVFLRFDINLFLTLHL